MDFTITEKEKEWLKKCTEEEHEFRSFKRCMLYLVKDLICCSNLAKGAKSLIDETADTSYCNAVVVKPIIDEIVIRLELRSEHWEEFVEGVWDNSKTGGLKMARKKTVTLKLSKEDHDLLIPDLDRNIKALRMLAECVEEDSLSEEETAKKEVEEIKKRKEEQKKENLDRLTEKEREWLKGCLEGENSFIKASWQELMEEGKLFVKLAEIAEHFIEELDLSSYDENLLISMVGTIKRRIGYQQDWMQGYLDDWVEAENN